MNNNEPDRTVTLELTKAEFEQLDIAITEWLEVLRQDDAPADDAEAMASAYAKWAAAAPRPWDGE